MALSWPRVAAFFVFVLAFVIIARDASAQESPDSPPSEWRPGQPAPDGFVIKKSKRGKAFVIAGASVFAAGYVPAASLGFGGEILCATWIGSDSRGECAAAFAQAFIPIAG